MAYIRKNINLLLLIITLLLVGYTVSLTAYYQQSYEDVSSEYYANEQAYEKVIEDLKEREAIINQTSYELTRKTQDTQKLGALIEEVETAKESVESELSDTSTLLSIANAQLKSAQDELSIQKAKAATLQSKLDSINDELSELNEFIGDAKDDLDDDYNLTSSQIDDLFENIDDSVSDIEKDAN